MDLIVKDTIDTTALEIWADIGESCPVSAWRGWLARPIMTAGIPPCQLHTVLSLVTGDWTLSCYWQTFLITQ